MITKDQRQMKVRCHVLARYGSPIDTGLLRYKAIKSHLKKNGFDIIFDHSVAYYIPYLDTGTAVSSKHVGFIENIKSQIEQMIFEHYCAGKKRWTQRTRMMRHKMKEDVVDDTLLHVLRKQNKYRYRHIGDIQWERYAKREGI